MCVNLESIYVLRSDLFSEMGLTADKQRDITPQRDGRKI